MRTIRVASEFSRYPAGRFKSDGPFSGEHFRDRFLVPSMKYGGLVEIEMDGTRGYGSSFLEEAFGGLIRLGYDANTVKHKFIIKTSNASLLREISDYIEHATPSGGS